MVKQVSFIGVVNGLGCQCLKTSAKWSDWRIRIIQPMDDTIVIRD